ncbi:MAG: hypothetical protein ABJN35_14125 [Erythrobacter sp.]
MRTFGIALSAVAIAALASAGVTPLAAQEPVDDLLPNAACFDRVAESGDLVSIFVPVQASSGMLAKGFERQPCRVRFSLQSQREAWRDEICSLASERDEFFQSQAEIALGERPAVLCALAEIIAGPWKREGARSE